MKIMCQKCKCYVAYMQCAIYPIPKMFCMKCAQAQ